MKVNEIAIKQGVHDGAYEIVWHNGCYIDENRFKRYDTKYLVLKEKKTIDILSKCVDKDICDLLCRGFNERYRDIRGGGNFRLYYTIEGDINIYPI
jgi:hypothetical protein